MRPVSATFGLSGGLRCFIYPSDALCDVKVIARASSNFARTVEAKNNAWDHYEDHNKGTTEVLVIRARGTGRGEGHTVVSLWNGDGEWQKNDG